MSPFVAAPAPTAPQPSVAPQLPTQAEPAPQLPTQEIPTQEIPAQAEPTLQLPTYSQPIPPPAPPQAVQQPYAGTVPPPQQWFAAPPPGPGAVPWPGSYPTPSPGSYATPPPAQGVVPNPDKYATPPPPHQVQVPQPDKYATPPPQQMQGQFAAQPMPGSVPTTTAGLPTVSSSANSGSVNQFFAQLFASFGLRQLWGRAAQLAGVAFAAAFVAALLVIVLSWSLTKQIGDQTGARVNDVGAILTMALQLVGAGFGGPLTWNTRGGLGGAEFVSVAVTFHSFPLLVPVLAGVGLWIFIWFRPLAAGITTAQKVAIGVAAGAIFATATTMLSVVVPLRFSVALPGVSGSVSISSASFAGWLAAFVAISVFVTWRDGGPLQLPRSWAAVIAGALIHLGGLVLMGLIGVTIWVSTYHSPFSEGPKLIAFVPFLGLTAAVWVMVLSLFGSVGLDVTKGGSGIGLNPDELLGSFASLDQKVRELGPLGEPISVTSPVMPGWASTLLLLALVMALVAGIVVYLRGGADGPMALLRSAATWTVIGLVITLASGIGMSVKATSMKVTSPEVGVSFGPTGTTFLVLALWGLITGAMALWVAPHISGALPAGLVAFIQRGVPAAPVPAALTQPAVPVVQPQPGVPVQPQSGVPAQPGFPGVQPGAAGIQPQPPAGASFMFNPVAAQAPPVGSAVSMPATSVDGLPVVAKGNLTPGARKGLIIGGVIVGLIVVAAVVLPILRSTVFGPVAAVRTYMGALERGQASKALEFTGQGPLLQGVSGVLLSDAAYAAATDRPTNIAVGKVKVDGDIARVEVTYTQEDTPRDVNLTLTRTGTSWLIADEWRLKDPMALTTVSVENASMLEERTLTISGVDVPMDSPEMSFSALPGTYKVTVKETQLMQRGEGVVRANGSSGVAFRFEDVPNELFASKAVEATAARINECAARHDAFLPGQECPFSFASYASTAHPPVIYKVVQQPTLVLTHDASVGWEVTSTTLGRYTYSYTSNYFGSSIVNENTSSFAVRARVGVGKDNAVTVQYFH